MNPSQMGQLYPIIRRVRRPLLPVEPAQEPQSGVPVRPDKSGATHPVKKGGGKKKGDAESSSN
jgi:hypothetical protein